MSDQILSRCDFGIFKIVSFVAMGEECFKISDARTMATENWGELAIKSGDREQGKVLLLGKEPLVTVRSGCPTIEMIDELCEAQARSTDLSIEAEDAGVSICLVVGTHLNRRAAASWAWPGALKLEVALCMKSAIGERDSPVAYSAGVAQAALSCAEVADGTTNARFRFCARCPRYKIDDTAYGSTAGPRCTGSSRYLDFIQDVEAKY